MKEQYFLYNFRDCADWFYQISSYTLQVALLDESRLVFEPLLLISQFPNFLKLFDNLQKVLLTNIYDGIPFLFVLLRPYFGLESQSGNQPISWYFQFSFWLWRCGFHLVQTVKLWWDVQGDGLVTTLDLFVIPKLRWPQFFMFTDRNRYSSPVNFSSQNVFRVEQPW